MTFSSSRLEALVDGGDDKSSSTGMADPSGSGALEL